MSNKNTKIVSEGSTLEKETVISIENTFMVLVPNNVFQNHVSTVLKNIKTDLISEYNLY